MNAALLERQVALAAVALLAALGVLVLDRPAAPPEPTAVAEPAMPPVAGKWYEAAVGVYGPGLYGRATECGLRLDRKTRGVAHPILPCGARIVVSHGGREADTRVVDRGPYGQGQEFALTQALAGELGVSGVQIVRWRFSAGER